MKRNSKYIKFILILFCLLAGRWIYATDFKAGSGQFMLNGEPYIVKAAELHYPRIPRQYWDHRIKMSKALGMNTVCLYVFWNIHEPEKGAFDFTGQNDLREFVKLCKENDMNVILRPGPYVCAEWEMGGLPWWLLAEDIPLRTDDERFLKYVEMFEKQVASELSGMMAADGGPIIMVQVENEYGSYDTNKAYIEKIRDILRREYGSETLLFQCDWSSNFTDNGLDDLLWTMNFGTGADVKKEFKRLRELRPESPLMCSEYWSGWFDKWGANHETRPADAMVAGIDTMLANNISFSLYMTHGGTNWGHWAGANSPGFAPDVTSYDYDAPISEQGAPTPKYYLLRDLMGRYSARPLPNVPDTIPTGGFDSVYLKEFVPLANLITSYTAGPLLPMEKHGIGYGSIAYRTVLDRDRAPSALTVNGAHDYAVISINGRRSGIIDRRMNQTSIPLGATHAGDTLDIFVEAMGRINFGRAIADYKGITGHVTIGGDTLTEWTTALLEDKYDIYSSASTKAIDTPNGPGLYRGNIKVDTPADTYVDLSGWGKGLAYVNGHPLGRFWNIGPQQTLYLPGCWLKEGDNELLILDILGPDEISVTGRKTPIMDVLHDVDDNQVTSLEINCPPLDTLPVAEIMVADKGNWKHLAFQDAKRGRFIALEIPAVEGDGGFAIAELALTADGKRLGNDLWQPVYVTSAVITGNHTIDKAFDIQESTYWQASRTDNQIVVIDTGTNRIADGLDILLPAKADNSLPSQYIKVYYYGN